MNIKYLNLFIFIPTGKEYTNRGILALAIFIFIHNWPYLIHQKFISF